MKKITLLFLLLTCTALRAQVTNQNFILTSGAGDAYANVWWTILDPTTAGTTNAVYTNTAVSATIHFVSSGPFSGWILYITYAGVFAEAYASTNNFPISWINSGDTNPSPVGTYLIYPQLTNWVQRTTNYWPVTGDTATFSASGRDFSSGTNSNQLVITLDGSQIFIGPRTAGAGLAWNLSGRVLWDGSNFYSFGTLNSGDTNTPVWIDSELITNGLAGTNTWTWSVNGETNNLQFNAASISATRMPSNDIPDHLFGTPVIFQFPSTVVNAGDSTAGYGAGLMRWDTNYIYLSVGTNSWKRVWITNW